jgi:hypothetical protein
MYLPYSLSHPSHHTCSLCSSVDMDLASFSAVLVWDEASLNHCPFSTSLSVSVIAVLGACVCDGRQGPACFGGGFLGC